MRIDPSLAVVFGHYSCFIKVYYRGVFPKFYKDPWEQEVKRFFECDGKDGQFSISVQQRLRDSERYADYLKKTGALPASGPEEPMQAPNEPPISDL